MHSLTCDGRTLNIFEGSDNASLFFSDKLDNNHLEFVIVFFANECSFMLV